MKQPLKENGGLPASILWTLAIVAGVSVANIYYIQPLLNMIRHELGISEFRTNLIAMVTQIGYAAGLLFITPLGDLYQRKKIILVNVKVHSSFKSRFRVKRGKISSVKSDTWDFEDFSVFFEL